MHVNTLAKLGLAPTATAAQIATALHSPAPGRPAEAWNTEVKERMQSHNANWTTAWADCQQREPNLYAAYERDCAMRNQQVSDRKSADAEDFVRGMATLNSKALPVFPVADAMGRTSNAKPLPDLITLLRTANASASPDFVKRLRKAADAFMAVVDPQPTDSIPAIALRTFLYKGLEQLENAQ